MNLREDRLDLTTGLRRVMVGDELLAQPSHDPITTPDGIAHPSELAGASVLLIALQREMGTHEQDMQIASLEAFFNHQRGHMSMLDYMTMWRLVHDEAEASSGLVLNPVARSFMLLRASGMSERQKYDFRMQIGGDLSRFEDLFQIMLRFAKSDMVTHSSTLPAMAEQRHADHGGHWPDEDWSEQTWYQNDGWDAMSWDESSEWSLCKGLDAYYDENGAGEQLSEATETWPLTDET